LNPGLAAALGQGEPPGLDARATLVLLGHSVALGLVLMLITWWASRQVHSRALPAAPGAAADEKALSPTDQVLSAANVMYLCFGMAGVMILVNNNLARAFAIGAAIALVRFRVKVDSKGPAMALFYGVLAGMACGVDRVAIGWGIAAVFALMQGVVLGLLGVLAPSGPGGPSGRG
jgi:hypothetical protein